MKLMTPLMHGVSRESRVSMNQRGDRRVALGLKGYLENRKKVKVDPRELRGCTAREKIETDEGRGKAVTGR